MSYRVVTPNPLQTSPPYDRSRSASSPEPRRASPARSSPHEAPRAQGAIPRTATATAPTVGTGPRASSLGTRRGSLGAARWIPA